MSDGRSVAVVVGLKYCGGCRADYDRVALVEEIRRRLAEKAAWVPSDDPAAELILAVHGCLTACADLHPCQEQAKPIFPVTGPQAAEAFVQHVRTMKRKNPLLKESKHEPFQRTNLDGPEGMEPSLGAL